MGEWEREPASSEKVALCSEDLCHCLGSVIPFLLVTRCHSFNGNLYFLSHPLQTDRSDKALQTNFVIFIHSFWEACVVLTWLNWLWSDVLVLITRWKPTVAWHMRVCVGKVYLNSPLSILEVSNYRAQKKRRKARQKKPSQTMSFISLTAHLADSLFSGRLVI